MGRKNEYIGGFISPSEYIYIAHPIISKVFPNTKIIAEYLMVKGLKQYTEYKRRRISILDVWPI